jgi:hypothetical protein
MTDHHDFADHNFGDDHHEPVPFDEHLEQHELPDEHVPWEPDDHHFDVPAHDDGPAGDHPAYVADEHPVEPLADEQPVVADLSGAELSDNVFPPPVDVGELPEPVDGFPWIDTGSLGLADIQAALHDAAATEPVPPSELAEYAGTDLPPGADPWAHLAESDDPATAALAKWWSEQN